MIYDPKRQRYLKEDGTIANEAEVRLWLRDKIGLERLRLKRLMSQQVSSRISVKEWRDRVREELRSTHTRMAALAAGGEDRLTPRHYQILNQVLWQEESYLDRFAKDLGTNGPIRTGRLARAASYADAIKLTFYAAELTTKKAEGDWLGWRWRDPANQSCRPCTRHDTRGFVSVDQIVPIGWQCDCRNRCQCRIRYRRKL